jgi:hypothetical protein
VLEGIIRYPNKRDLYKNVFNGNPDNDNPTWKAINKLHELGLIFIVRKSSMSGKRGLF